MLTEVTIAPGAHWLRQ